MATSERAPPGLLDAVPGDRVELPFMFVHETRGEMRGR